MFLKMNRPLVVGAVTGVVLAGMLFGSHMSLASRGKIQPFKLAIIATGDDRGQVKPVCT